MSLIHWWPLNGDLLDRAGNNSLQYINSSGKIVTNNSGKLGKCYERAAIGSADLLRSKETMKVFTEESICAWIYVSQHAALKTANGVVTNHDHTTNSGLGIGVYSSDGTNYYVSINAGNGSSRIHSTYWGQTNIKDAWHHVCLVSNGSTIKMYVDGKEDRAAIDYSVYSKADYLDIFNWSTGYYTQTSYRPACKVCDVRIYDHALSVKEVQELSKGLMLHYTFNDIGSENTTNLVTGVTKGGQTTVDTNQVVTTSGADSDTYFYLKLSKTLEAGKTYTLSCVGENIQMNSGGYGKYFRFGLQGQGGVPQISIYNGPSSLTFTATSTQAVNSLLLDDITGHRSLNNSKFYNFQMEEKDHATSYVKGSRNNPYYDESGYNHDGIQNQIDYISDSNNGSCCASFNGTHSYIEVPNWKPTLPNEPYTMAFWVNPAEDKTRDIYFGNYPTTNGTFNIERNTNNYLRVYYNSDTPIGPISTVTIPSGVWTHVVITFDGITFKAYKDGVEKYSKTLSQTLNCTNTNWKIGSDYRTAVGTSEATRYKGLMSDFRIYASALTPAQVLELYESKAEIDKNQNVFTNEIVEQSNSNMTNANSWEAGAINDASGTENNQTNLLPTRIRSKYIPVLPSTTYYFATKETCNVRSIYYYTKDLSFISFTSGGGEKITPSNCYFVRYVLLPKSSSDTIDVSNIALYEPSMVPCNTNLDTSFGDNIDVQLTKTYQIKTKDICENHDVGFFKDGTASGNNFYEI